MQVSIVLLIGSKMPEILATLSNSCLDEKNMEDALSPKTLLDN